MGPTTHLTIGMWNLIELLCKQGSLVPNWITVCISAMVVTDSFKVFLVCRRTTPSQEGLDPNMNLLFNFCEIDSPSENEGLDRDSFWEPSINKWTMDKLFTTKMSMPNISIQSVFPKSVCRNFGCQPLKKRSQHLEP